MTLPTRNEDQNTRRPWGIALALLLAAGVLSFAALQFFASQTNSRDVEFIPITLNSKLEADYRADPDPIRLPGVRLDIIWDTVSDRESETSATDIKARQEELRTLLLTPVPTVIPTSTCQGIHFVYASQDTWIDSANPAAIHGNETLLQFGRDGNQIKRVLLYFPIHETLPPGAFIRSARLELDVAQFFGEPGSEALIFFNLRDPFEESTTVWRNQPGPAAPYPAGALASGSIHIWDMTEVVRDWLSGRHPNDGLMFELQEAGNYSVVYYSREIISQAGPTPNATAIPLGPRLILNCGLVNPQAVSVKLPTPGPEAVPTQDDESPSSQKTPPATPATNPTPAPPPPTPNPSSPTSRPPVNTPPPAPTNPPATSIASPPPPNPSPTAPPPPAPPPDDDDDGGSEQPIPLPTAPPLTVALAVSKDDSPDPIVAGDDLTYTLRVTNSGSSQATDVNLTDTLPAGVSFFSAIVTQGSCSGTNPVACNLGAMPAGHSITATIVVTVDPAATGTLLNTAAVFANETDATTASAQTTIIAETDLAISKVDTPDPVIAGQTLTYTLIVTNNGPSTASGVVMTDTLPVGVVFDSTTSSPSCNEAGGVVTCNVGAMTVGSSRQRTIAVTVEADTTGILTNRADVGGNEVDPDGSNNMASTMTAVNTLADVALSKSDTPTLLAAGEILTYTLTVVNSGPSDVQNVVVTDTLPLSITFNSATPVTDTQSGQDIGWDLGPLTRDGTQVITMVVTVDSGFSGSLSNTATVTTTTADPDATNNSDTEMTLVTTKADLEISKADSPDPVSAGAALTYTLTVENLGPTAAQNVIVTDTVPFSFTVSGSNPVSDIQSGQDLGWNLGVLANGVTQTIVISGVVDSGFEGVLTNTASVTSTTFDPVTANNSAIETTLTPSGCVAPHPVTGYVTSISPADLATGVSVSPTITIQFNQSMDASTLINSDKKYLVLCDATSCNAPDLVPTTLVITRTTFATDTVLMTPVVPLAINTTYYINVGNFIENICGTKVGVKIKTEFTTGQPDLAINDMTVSEGDSGTTDAVFTVTLSATGGQTVTVDYATMDNTATAGSDYVAVPTTMLTFPPGTTVQTFTVVITGDTIVEGDERFTATLSNPSNAAIADGEGIGTLIDEPGGRPPPFGGTRQIYLPLVMKTANLASSRPVQATYHYYLPFIVKSGWDVAHITRYRNNF